MTRRFWIAGLLVALFVYGGFAFMCAIALLRHHHLNMKGWIVLTCGGYICWITVAFLRQKIAEGRKALSN